MRLNGYDYSELVRIIDLFLESQYGETWHSFCENYIKQRDIYERDEESANEENENIDEEQQEN